MYSLMRFGVLFLLLISLGGCFAKPSPGTDYGPEPVNYEDQVKAFFESRLKDPYSAHYRFGGRAVKGYCNQGLAYGGNIAWFGWAVPVQINAKNSFGAYTGFSTHWVFFNPQGQIVYQAERANFEDVLCTAVD